MKTHVFLCFSLESVHAFNGRTLLNMSHISEECPFVLVKLTATNLKLLPDIESIVTFLL